MRRSFFVVMAKVRISRSKVGGGLDCGEFVRRERPGGLVSFGLDGVK